MSSGYYLSSAFYYFNLGAHMIYILRSRLEAQNISRQKSVRILGDTVNAIFKEHFVSNILLPQDPPGINSFKELFSILAHSSIMKLDQTSMEKLFLLMLMSVKNQIYLVSSPLELYTLTLSHLLNIIKKLEQGSQSVFFIEFAIEKFQKTALKYTFLQYLEIRESILSEVEKYQKKVVNLIELGTQNNSGKMVFKFRNSHNQKSIGSATNQSDLEGINAANTQNQLFYNKWNTWKTSLIIDFAQDYKKSLKKNNQKIGLQVLSAQSQAAEDDKEKGLKDILNVRFDDIQNFQVKFDLLGTQQTNSKYEKDDQQLQQSLKSAKNNIKLGPNNQTNSYKSSIQKEFSDLKFGKEEDEVPDLLNMMDN